MDEPKPIRFILTEKVLQKLYFDNKVTFKVKEQEYHIEIEAGISDKDICDIFSSGDFSEMEKKIEDLEAELEQDKDSATETSSGFVIGGDPPDGMIA